MDLPPCGSPGFGSGHWLGRAGLSLGPCRGLGATDRLLLLLFRISPLPGAERWM